METQALTAYPVVQDAPNLVTFLSTVFGAQEKFRTVGPAGGYHIELRIGDTALMTGGGGPDVAWTGESCPMAFHIYVPDVNATYRLALETGAQSLQPPTDQPWGERTANIKDPAGNNWYIATFQDASSYSGGAPAVQPYLQPLQAEPVIAFLVEAFGATESGRAATPEGAILHTTLHIRNSALELSDANGIYGPMPGMFYLYVENTDAAYRRALDAGAASVTPPGDQSYGDRTATIRDVSGNLWYLAAPKPNPGTAKLLI